MAETVAFDLFKSVQEFSNPIEIDGIAATNCDKGATVEFLDI